MKTITRGTSNSISNIAQSESLNKKWIASRSKVILRVWISGRVLVSEPLDYSLITLPRFSYNYWEQRLNIYKILYFSHISASLDCKQGSRGNRRLDNKELFYDFNYCSISFSETSDTYWNTKFCGTRQLYPQSTYFPTCWMLLSENSNLVASSGVFTCSSKIFWRACCELNRGAYI